eukprot:5116707-Pleurochrysis_carterae.AAC.4
MWPSQARTPGLRADVRVSLRGVTDGGGEPVEARVVRRAEETVLRRAAHRAQRALARQLRRNAHARRGPGVGVRERQGVEKVETRAEEQAAALAGQTNAAERERAVSWATSREYDPLSTANRKVTHAKSVSTNRTVALDVLDSNWTGHQ